VSFDNLLNLRIQFFNLQFLIRVALKLINFRLLSYNSFLQLYYLRLQLTVSYV